MLQGKRMSILRQKLLTLSDEDLARLILVADHALCDIGTTAMIAEEIDIEANKLHEFGESVVAPFATDAEISFGWYGTTQAQG